MQWNPSTGSCAAPSAWKNPLTIPLVKFVPPTSPVLVPGLAFDREGFRLGYGGGFYDTFLPNFPGTSIGLIRACQLVERLAVRDVHDAPVNIVALEQGSAYVANR